MVARRAAEDTTNEDTEDRRIGCPSCSFRISSSLFQFGARNERAFLFPLEPPYNLVVRLSVAILTKQLKEIAIIFVYYTDMAYRVAYNLNRKDNIFFIEAFVLDKVEFFGNLSESRLNLAH